MNRPAEQHHPIPFPLIAVYVIGLTLIALNLKNYLLN